MRLTNRLEGGLHRVHRDALGLPRFRVSESVSPWMTIAGGGDSPFFDLERLISRQKVARATVRVMWSTSATSFQANPLRRARHGSTLMRKIAIRFLQTPVGELRTAKFHRLASKVGSDETVQTKVGYLDGGERQSVPRDVAFSRLGRGSGMAGITNTKANGPVHGPTAPSSFSCFPVKPT
jgi:hypothetical protein